MTKIEWITEDVVLMIWYLLGCVALTGFTFKVKIAAPIIWKVYFLILVVAAAVFSTFLIFGITNGASSETLEQAILMLLLQTPFWYAVWAYAYRSKELWAKSV